MKRMIALTLAVLMALSLCACGGSQKQQAAEPGFKAGFGQVDITPNYSVPLAGYGNTMNRMSQGYMDYLYATCIAVQDAQGEMALFITVDSINFYDGLLELVRPAVVEATGVKADRIVLAGTHTHSAPDMNSTDGSIAKYKEFFSQCVADAAKAAIKDLSGATIQTGTGETENLTFVRHYVMNDGTYSGPNFGDSSSGYKAHEREADEQIQLVRFVRSAKGKDDILMVNWQSHPLVASTNASDEGLQGRSMMSPDFIGTMRNYVGEQTGCKVAFFQGAAGNLNPRSNIASEQSTVPTDVNVYGQKLGDYVIAAMENMTQIEAGSIVSKQTIYQGEVDHTEDDLLDYARVVQDLWTKTNNFNACLTEGKPHGVMGPYHAGAIIRRATSSVNQKAMELNAITIGNVGFVTAPYEMFCQNGQQIKEGSPYDITFVITCSNGHNSYIAADEAFAFGSYEVHARTFIRGTGEALANELVSMLNDISGK